MARQLPHVWRRFWSLPLGTDFFLGDRLYFKWDCWRASAAEFTKPQFTFVMPWRKVRTTELLRDALAGGLSSADLKQAQGRTFRQLRDEMIDKYTLPQGTVVMFPESSEGVGKSFHRGSDEAHVDDNRTGPSA